MKLLFQSVKIIDSQSKHHNSTTDVLVEDGMIKTIKNGIPHSKDYLVVKKDSLCLSPGLFDLQVNYRDPGYDWKEDINTGIKSSSAGGFTGVLLMPSNHPSTDTKVQLDYINNKSKDTLVEVIPAGNITKENKGIELTEMYEMSQSGAKVFTDDRNSIQQANVMKLALLYSKNFDGILMNQPNDQLISANGKMNEGITSTALGLKGIPALAEEVMLTRDIKLAEYTDGKLHVNRVSSKKSVEIIRQAKKKGIAITADVAIHQLILTDEDCQRFDSNYKVFPPLRTSTDKEALIEGLKDGTIDAICSDHCPEDIEHKVLTFDNAEFGIIGAQTTFPLACELQDKLGMSTIIDVLSKNPRKILGLEKATIEEGQKANLCCFTQNEKWEFSHESNLSKSNNSPFIGRTFTTKVIGTVKGQHTTF